MPNGRFQHCTSLEQMLGELVNMQREETRLMRTDQKEQTPQKLVEKIMMLVEIVRNKFQAIVHLPESANLDETARKEVHITNAENFRDVLCANIRRLPNIHDRSVDAMIQKALDRIHATIGSDTTKR